MNRLVTSVLRSAVFKRPAHLNNNSLRSVSSSILTTTTQQQQQTQHQSQRSFATGTRGSRGHGWYVNYRAGKGGRHLQGEYQDRSKDDCQAWNASVVKLGSKTAYLDVVVEPARSNAFVRGKVPDLNTLVGEKHRLYLELATAALPETCQNFIDLCQADTEGYKGTLFYRIEPGVGICGGDVLTNIGKTGKAAAGTPLQQRVSDPLPLWHVAGTVSMVVTQVEDIDSRFILCTSTSHHLDGINRAFATMTPESVAVVKEWETTLLTKQGVPASCDLVIVGAGVEDEAVNEQAA